MVIQPRFFLIVPAVLLALPLALLPLPYAGGIALGLAVAVLALIDPIWAVYAAILSVPVQELIQLPGGLTLTQATLLLGIAALALHTLSAPERPLPLGGIFPALALLLLALFASLVFSPYSQAEALRELLRWSTVPLIYLLTLRSFQQTRDRRQKTRGSQEEISCRGAESPLSPVSGLRSLVSWKLYGLLACLLLAPAADAGLGLVQFWYGIGPASFGVGGGHVRAYGTIGQPNSFAGYMNQAWPLALSLTGAALIWLWRGAPRRLGLAVLLGLGGLSGLLLAGLLASFSRGGWVGALGGGLALALGCVALLAPRLRRMGWRVLTAGAGGLALILALGGSGMLPGALANRLASITGSLRIFDVRGVEISPDNFAVVERMAHIQAAWNMVVRHPLTGVGAGNYSIAFEQTPPSGELPITTRPWYTSRGHAHNYYLHIAAESGVLGAAAYVLLLGSVGLQAIRAIRRPRSAIWAAVAVGCAGVTAALALHNLFENLHVLNMGLQLGTTWALLVVAERADAEG